MNRHAATLTLLAIALAGCTAPPRQDPQPVPRAATPQRSAREVFPGVWLDASARTIDLPGMIPIRASESGQPRVYLEVIACSRDTKEHEALVVIDAKPSHVHAGLLLAGLTPGRPGAWDWEGTTIRAIPPEGPTLRVQIIDSAGRAHDPRTWVTSARGRRTLNQAEPQGRFLFAGSQFAQGGQGAYRADGEGCVVGLTTFGGEVVAWSNMHSPDAATEDPDWIAAAGQLPEFGARVTLRLTLDQ